MISSKYYNDLSSRVHDEKAETLWEASEQEKKERKLNLERQEQENSNKRSHLDEF